MSGAGGRSPSAGGEQPTVPRHSDQLRRAAGISQRALSLPPDELEAFLEAEVAQDPELRSDVLRLLVRSGSEAGVRSPGRADRRRIEALSQKAALLLARMPASGDTLAPGEQVGRYKIVRLLGEGGMGTVYEAEQENPRRRVAVKLLQSRLSSVGELQGRFRREADILGRLSHPGIARIIEAGVAELERGTRPFFAMELVEGLPVLAHAEAKELSTRERLGLVADICDAVEHAHRLGVVHRDLKPENILVDGDGQPKILDFGVAHLTDADVQAVSVRTTAGDILGTVPYMSPEQIAGRGDQIDERTDVHALGVLAFELVSGRRPYRLEGLPLAAAARVIQEDEPSQLGELRSSWRGDVETIIGKALEKEKGRRYASAADLARDIRRFLDNEPIAARPPSVRYRAVKFARRNKALVGGLIGILLSLSLGLAVSVRFGLRALERERESQRNAYRVSLVAAQSALLEGDPTAADYLASAPEQLRGWEWELLAARLDETVRTLPPPAGGGVLALALSDDGSKVLTVRGNERDASDRRLVVLDARSGEPLRELDLARERPLRLAADELALARAHAPFLPGEPELEYRDAGSGELLALDRACEVSEELRSPRVLAGTIVAFRGGSGPCDLSTGRPVALRTDGRSSSQSPDASRYALARSVAVHVQDARTGAELSVLVDGKDDVTASAFLDGGSRLVTASWNGWLRLWDVDSGELLAKERVSPSRLTGILAHEDTGRVVSWGVGQGAQVWDAREGRLLKRIPGPWSDDGEAALSSDGSLLLRSNGDGAIRFWSLGARGEPTVLRGHESFVYPLAVSRDGRRVFSVAWDATLRAWNADTGEQVAVLAEGTEARALLVSPDGELLHAWGSTLSCHDAWTGELLGSREATAGPRWEPDGRLSARITLDGDRSRRVFLDPRTLELQPGEPEPEPRVLTSPDRRAALHRDDDGRVEVRAVEDGSLIRVLAESGVRGQVGVLGSGARSWAPDGRAVALSATRDIYLWSAPHWEGRVLENVHLRRVHSLAFSPDGRLLASAGGDGNVLVWDVERGELLLRLRGHEAYVWQLAWSDDGRRLVSSSGDTTLRVWDTISLAERWAMRDEQRRARDELGPLVDGLLDEHGSPRSVLEELRTRLADADDARRRAALDLLLARSVARAR